MKVAPTTESLIREYSKLVKKTENIDPNIFTSETRNQSGRNRYHNILPNEPTRFKIEKNRNFYFNANWVLGQQAIACQGPLPKEIDQFWEMVWHSDVSTIVMVANPIEDGKSKCSMYWKGMPSTEDVVFENGEQAIFKRTIPLTKGEEKKTIVQYQLVNWPDQGIVKPEILAELVKVTSKEKGKILVHCSAGVGRTGTFLAVYEANRQGTDQIYKIAKTLRHPNKGRVGMMQKFEQYQLAHKTAQLLLNKPI